MDESKLLEAANQLQEYMKTPVFKGKTTVKAWAVVVLNNKLHVKVVQ